MNTITSSYHRIGFMQGRLVAPVFNRIQAFPREQWEKELELAKYLGFNLIEWVLDLESMDVNPILKSKSAEVRVFKDILDHFNIRVESVNCDVLMQSPLWNPKGREIWDIVISSLIRNAPSIGIKTIVIPFVDNSSIKDREQEELVVNYLRSYSRMLRDYKLKFAFEMDYNSSDAIAFISKFNIESYGINYDTGNSASLGYNPLEELRCYGHRITNIHIKDRLLKGTTVPLQEGDVDFPCIFRYINSKLDYKGNLILQTARAKDDDHISVIIKYRDLVSGWLASL